MAYPKQFYVSYSFPGGFGAIDVVIKDFTSFNITCVKRIGEAIKPHVPENAVILNIIPLDAKEIGRETSEGRTP